MKKKQIKRRQKRRMTELDIRMVVEEINAWKNGERGPKLTWAKLERIFPFTRQTMYSKESIREAYKNDQMPIKTGGKTQTSINLDQLAYIEVQRLKNRVKELEAQVEEWQKLWILLKT